MKKLILIYFLGVLFQSCLLGTAGYPIYGSKYQNLKGDVALGPYIKNISPVTPNIGDTFNPTAKTLSHALDTVTVKFTTLNDQGSLVEPGNLTTVFSVTNIPTSVIQAGLYVSAVLETVPGGVKITTLLTDISNNVYGYVTGVSGQKANTNDYYFSVNTMTVTFKDSQGNTVTVDNVPIGAGKSVWFQGTGGSPTAHVMPPREKVSQVFAAGETLANLGIDLTFANNDAVSLTFLPSQLTSIHSELVAGKPVTVSCALDGTSSNYAATIHAKTSQGNVSGFPFNLSSSSFQTSGGKSIPTSNNPLSKRIVRYRTSNMRKSISLPADDFTFNIQSGSQVLKGAGKQQDVAKRSSAKVQHSTSAGGRF